MLYQILYKIIQQKLFSKPVLTMKLCLKTFSMKVYFNQSIPNLVLKKENKTNFQKQVSLLRCYFKINHNNNNQMIVKIHENSIIHGKAI